MMYYTTVQRWSCARIFRLGREIRSDTKDVRLTIHLTLSGLSVGQSPTELARSNYGHYGFGYHAR